MVSRVLGVLVLRLVSLHAYCRAGGPVTSGVQAFPWPRRRSDPEAPSGWYGCSSWCYQPVVSGQSREMRLMQPLPSTSSTHSLAPVLLLRRRIKSVADVLRGIRQHGFSQARWDALYW